MKNKILLFALVGAMFTFTACEEDTDSYDFSNSMPAYVEIASKAPIEKKEGETATITFRSRENFQQAKSLKYEVTGAFTANGTVALARNTTSVKLELAIPDGIVPAGSTSAVATLSLIDADGLTVGYNGADKEKVTINIEAN